MRRVVGGRDLALSRGRMGGRGWRGGFRAEVRSGWRSVAGEPEGGWAPVVR